ncbi:MAG: EAL domain-containing response regulator [Frankiaceae bacterium]|nr:EAL domain-containing response regulator [Frankiaceae bacterium]
MIRSNIARPVLADDPTDVLRDARVVVVDDVAANVDVVDRMLRHAGVGEVVGYTDPVLALAECSTEPPDLVILDLHMPGLDGLTFLACLNSALDPEEFVPVLVLTADISDNTRRNALADGAKDFLTKPVDAVDVVLRVRNLLETRALYQRLREHTDTLVAELELQHAIEHEAAILAAERAERIDAALVPGTMSIAYQPVVDLATRSIVGAEALARFAGPVTRPPNEWFAEAALVDRLELLELAAVALALSNLDELPAGAFVSLNLSASTACTMEFASYLRRLPADRIVLEITEHTKVEDYCELRSNLADFIERGGRIAVDDAGTGYAGLEHILRMAPDIIKLDIALITAIDTDPAKRALVTSLVQFAAETGATIIAEGIETEDELVVLRELGVAWGQGYHLGRPAPLPLQLG